jgi:hypothetical protein
LGFGLLCVRDDHIEARVQRQRHDLACVQITRGKVSRSFFQANHSLYFIYVCVIAFGKKDAHHTATLLERAHHVDRVDAQFGPAKSAISQQDIEKFLHSKEHSAVFGENQGKVRLVFYSKWLFSIGIYLNYKTQDKSSTKSKTARLARRQKKANSSTWRSKAKRRITRNELPRPNRIPSRTWSKKVRII